MKLTPTPTQKITEEEQYLLSRAAKALARIVPRGGKFFCVIVLPETPETSPYQRVRLISSSANPQEMAAYLSEAGRYAGGKKEFHGCQVIVTDDKGVN